MRSTMLKAIVAEVCGTTYPMGYSGCTTSLSMIGFQQKDVLVSASQTGSG